MRNTMQRWLVLGVVACGAAATVGCSAPELTGATRVIYQSSAREGRKGRSEAQRMVLVHRTNTAFVDDDGGLKGDDRTMKIVSDPLLADMLERMGSAGFDSYAEPMASGDPVVPPGFSSVIIVEIGGTMRRIASPNPAKGRPFAVAYRAIFGEFLEVYQESTSFLAGSGTDASERPNWETKTGFGKDR
jgi:hypothetical protein